MAAPSSGKRSRNSPVPARAMAGRPERPLLVAALGVALLAAVALAYVLGRGSGDTAVPESGLPRTPDYHSLLVAPGDANTLSLGTHDGLFRSLDGGKTWTAASLAGNDAMNLSQPSARTVWAAGHDVLARSSDGGSTWRDVRPSGLPSLDVHGFAVDPRDPTRLLAAIAGEGLFRSTDGGESFRLVSREVGPGVTALAILPNGRLLAGDMATNTLATSDDGGATWESVVRARVMGLAVDPADTKRVLASGRGVLLSTDAGATWRQTLTLDAGTGPVAWSKSDPGTAFVVALDHSLYRSDDAGATWKQVVSP